LRYKRELNPNALFLLGVLAAASPLAPSAQRPALLGLDHIPVVVSDLERAGATFGGLGFALKPGRDLANGIRNAHVKFPDGAGIELLTAPKAVDALSTHYVDLLRAGEGPAFVSFHARDTGRLHTALRDGGYEFRQDGEITELRSLEFAYLFVVRDNRSPTDRPEHFAHANGAAALSAVWVAPENGDALARLLVHLGGRQHRRQVLAPDPVEATVVTLGEGEVFILPVRHQWRAGRPVIGASFTVPDLARVRRLLIERQITPWARTSAAERVVVEPSIAHGMWLEFRKRS
jgi:catechol 2,3-dioxygenase-like lactoylglutathione lyase family enzyme